jgi:hypothetical protein
MTTTLEQAPDVLGEIKGWRAWKVIGSESLPMLSSVTYSNTIWHPAHYTLASCSNSESCRKGGRLPGESCSCGLYAAASREQLVGLRYNEEDGSHPVFIGEVAFSGKVIPGSQGWRAERGRIARLYVPFRHWRFVEPLKALYRVPVVLDNTYSSVPTFGSERS